jgi:hypothetical protein
MTDQVIELQIDGDARDLVDQIEPIIRSMTVCIWRLRAAKRRRCSVLTNAC